MNDLTTQINKENEADTEEFLQDNREDTRLIDVTIFDETLKEIEKILNNLEQKMQTEEISLEKLNVLPEIKSAISKIHGAKNELIKKENIFIKDNDLLRRIENLEKNINHANDPILLSKESKNETVSEIEEHKIDLNLLSLEELHNFKKNDEKKEDSPFGFYSYVIFILVIFFTLFGILNISKDLIIFKYPKMIPYIEYFNEIIEILKVSILGFISFITNIIFF